MDYGVLLHALVYLLSFYCLSHLLPSNSFPLCSQPEPEPISFCLLTTTHLKRIRYVLTA